jgi:hypothetical protein
MKRLRLAAVLALLGGVALLPLRGNVSATSLTSVPKLAASGQLKPAVATIGGLTRTLPFLSGGTVATGQEMLGTPRPASSKSGAISGGSATSGTSGTADDLGIAMHSYGCGARDLNPQTKTLNGNSGNQRVNQDCTFRRQAEEEITFNPAEPTNFLAGQNDSRVGFNQCGIDFSPDNGLHWGDLLPPFRQRINTPQNMGPGSSNTARNTTTTDPNDNSITDMPGTMHTYDAGSDPTVAFDSRGRGYFSCVIFDVNDFASGIYVTESPLAAKGSFFFNVPSTAKGFMPVEDNDSQVFHDKQFITADIYPTSPNRDNVYITWTVFRLSPGGLAYFESPIYGSMSTDQGKTWSTPQEISGRNPTLCAGAFGIDMSRCDFDQGSDPIVLPNGDLEVVFVNGNSPSSTDQQLAVHCRPTGSSPAGTANLNCANPVLVGLADTTGAPTCNFGRGPELCIPGAFIRTNDFPRIAVNTVNGDLYTVWQDYTRRDNGNKEWSIQISQSTNGGAAWTRTQTVNPDTGLDHYFPANDIAEINGADRVGVSYYRTERVPNETGGTFIARPSCSTSATVACNSDYVVAGGTSLLTPYDFKVVSVVFPPPDGIQAGFNGDYSGLTINKGADAHPIWSDTRNLDPYAPQNAVVHDEDIYTNNVGLPNAQAVVAPGTIGKR